eukprot:TRINITY_DN16886_c0_g1_i1.p1 TRINITY_DN16886_c0_g1~~TRINITY_DN16886_c0_g1_i1.p1  ORF type:complete len:291 (-),score=67.49 TRINITY_DN16886_c0_g1_i1:71-898(-)
MATRVVKKTTLTVTVDPVKHLGIIQFSRPEKLNSFVSEQYVELAASLKELDADPEVTALVLTGSGRFYSSGHDLGGQAKMMMKAKASGQDLRAILTKSIKEQASAVVETLLDLKKPIICGINGPAVGFSVTSMALCDIVYAADNATFVTPFMKLGFCAEGCSSVIFPAVMGPSKANEMLLMGKTMTAAELERCGLISGVFPAASFHEELLKKAEILASYPPNALQQTKALTRDKEMLLAVNEKELALLVDRFLSPESISAVMAFMQQQSNKKAKL